MPALIIAGYINSFRAQKDAAEQAFKQLDKVGINWKPVAAVNTVAVLISHLSGHLNSRFGDFFTSNGEKTDRNRVKELADGSFLVSELEDGWNKSWAIVFATLNDMTDDDLIRAKMLRDEKMLVAGYIARVLSHTAYHTGQIVLLSKQYLGDKWKKLI